ncbi:MULTISPECIES: Crp/Fnr family transcriptional regulator [unclassified Paenibacillus]|uniref:Crp/Fnr family transcriptional regulator n=1 Tax=unclassified Paenibacillus TaxID=185978 RepID=UPI000CFCF064|nr:MULTISPECIES: cyclic nucleotide-binding domain-containing protein [unclassified Paenibacillus]MBD8840852.1 cyclic nucleotide-binding domain-containing protein [Paenibacillus sp. CFBP 13594]PRA03719.1 transcriptional regulator [Paenibacillus sp. MYb63]PRA47138.1 transcriptional regulator [Paenibacillus sp. MYb67]QZN76883.1 cyclic nucleotide-binding domain-containing protein [Paenibacillus sp. DR312]
MKEIMDFGLVRQLARENGLDQVLDEPALAELRLLEAAKGEMICAKGERPERLYFLVQGKLKIYTTLPNGKSLLLRFSTPLALVGDLELVNGKEAMNTVESVSKSLLLGISYRALQNTYAENPKFLHFMLSQVTHKLYTFSNLSSLNMLYPVESRFASYLLSTMGQDESSSEEIQTSKLTELADMLGTSYRHLNRVVQDLCNRNIIRKVQRKLLICDLEQLRAIAGGNIYE